MNIILYNQTNPINKIDKILTNGVTKNGTLHDMTSILNPSIAIKTITIPYYNYCYIPQFNRYYFITNISHVNNGLMQIDCKVDVLTSFSDDIKNSLAKTKISMNPNEYYNGVEISQEVRNETEKIIFPKNPFNEHGEIILVAINGTGVV